MAAGKEGKDAKSSQKGTPADRAAEAARRALRRDAERAAMRDVVDAGRAGETDALPAGEHFRAVAASAKAGVRRVCRREEAARGRRNLARGGLRHGLGVSDQARDSQEVGECALAGRWKATFASTGSLLNRDGIGVEERWASNRSWRLMCAGKCTAARAKCWRRSA